MSILKRKMCGGMNVSSTQHDNNSAPGLLRISEHLICPFITNLNALSSCQSSSGYTSSSTGLGVEKDRILGSFERHTPRTQIPCPLRNLSAIRNILGDFAVVLTGSENTLTTRQRRLNAYFNGGKRQRNTPAKLWFGAKTATTQQWHQFWLAWIHPIKMEVLRCNDNQSWDNLQNILKGIWAWAVWTSSNTCCGRGCHNAIIQTFNWASSRTGCWAQYGSLGTWVNDRLRDGPQEQRGGKFPLDRNCTPTCEDLKQ